MSGGDARGASSTALPADAQATLAQVEEAIARSGWVERVCRILVERTPLGMAWVGMIGDDGWIVPVAGAGVAAGILEPARISALDAPGGRGPTAIAARERRRVVTPDIARDDGVEAALPATLRSCAAFPVLLGDRCEAVLTVYASEPAVLDEDRLALLDRIAARLAPALDDTKGDALLRVAADAMLDSFTILSPVRDERGEIVDFRLKDCNDAYCALVGLAREQMLGSRIGELFPQFPGSHRFALYRRVALTGEPCRTDSVQGQPAWRGTPLSTRMVDTSIAWTGQDLVVSARDVTDHKRAEQELRLRAERLDLVHDAVIVREPVENRVAFWNREAEAIYGYSRAEALGRITHELLDTVFPVSREAVDEALARDGRWSGELRHRRRDGRRIVVSSRQALQRDDGGEPTAIIELNSDITERRQAEEALAHTTRLLERTEALGLTGGWEYEIATGELTWTNGVYRIYGLEPTSDPLDVAPAIEAYDADSAHVIAAAFERLVAEGEPYDLELGLVRADGRHIWVRTIGRPVIENHDTVRVGGTIADITERRRVEDEIRTLNAELERRVAARTAALERVNRELETFAYSVSHDLRAPLRAMDGFSRALLEDWADDLGEEGRHYLQRIRAGAVRMGNLIDDILGLSRLARRPFERTPVDVSALAREVAAELNSADPDRRVKVEIQDGLTATADAGLVRIVLRNLLGNAFKFTARVPQPRIRFGAEEHDGMTVYFVADNGAGFDMAHARGLFRPFHRLHRDSEFPGDGIGLATALRAVHRHDGAIWASGAVNEGATFSFTLIPGAQPPADAADSDAVTPAWPARHE